MQVITLILLQTYLIGIMRVKKMLSIHCYHCSYYSNEICCSFLSLINQFQKVYSVIPVLLLVVLNLVSYKLLGLDLPRSLVYGVASILVPAGFNRS